MSTLAVLQLPKRAFSVKQAKKATYGERNSVTTERQSYRLRKYCMATVLALALFPIWETQMSWAKERGQRRGSPRAIPVAVIEIATRQTSFVPITDRKKLTGAVLAGIGLGVLLGWRTRR